MVKNPESLVAQVFAARYCRDGDLLTARVKSNASFVWRSLVWNRDIVEEGLAWRVGRGDHISIYDDKWVTGINGTLRHFGEKEVEEGARVQSLISPDGHWDELKVRSSFSPLARDCILSTPIGETRDEDEIFWKFDEKGQFSVKSAYLLAIGFYTSNAHVSEPDKKCWSKLVWNVPIPPKARVFLWRALNNMIPTPANLKEHHVPSLGICGLCGDRWGSTEHCLLYCPKVAHVWKESRFNAIVKRAKGLDLFDVAAAVRGETGTEDYAVWALLLWEVWTWVCRLLHPRDGEAAMVSENTSVAQLEAFQAARPAVERAEKLGLVLGERKWSKPRCGLLRVDVDAHFKPEAREFSVGVVVRDHSGHLVAALAKPVAPSSSPMMAEVMAVVHGLVFCVERDLAPVELYTDSFLAARLMADREEEALLLPDDVCDILRVARENFLYGVSHMFRSANYVAHSLALRAATYSQPMCWTDSFPLWLRECILEDLKQ